MSAPRRRHRGRGGQGGHEPSERIQTRERRALDLSIQGWTQHEIAGDLGVSQAAVSKILRRVEERHLQEIIGITGRQKARQTLRLEHLYGQAIRAWEQSKADLTRRRQRKTQPGAGDAGTSVAEVVVENQHGDSRYLEASRKVLADLRGLWGLDAPQQVAVQATRNPYADMTEAELLDLLHRQATLLQAGDPVEPVTAPPPTEPTDDTDR